jgi:uncharacterized transporter YbjL
MTKIKEKIKNGVENMDPNAKIMLKFLLGTLAVAVAGVGAATIGNAVGSDIVQQVGIGMAVGGMMVSPVPLLCFAFASR